MKKKDGYVVDTPYPVFFYKEMTPLWLYTVATFLGFRAPQPQQEFSYLELACAQGINLIVCAINYPQASFVGVDFNATHIEKAQILAKNLGLKNIQFFHADFQTFLETNTQQFDFIVNHGTYSWIAPEQQQQILEIVAQGLKPQGLMYLHYMCYPGSADLSAVQKILNTVHQHMQNEDALAVAKQLCGDLKQAGAFIHQPKIEAALKTLQHSDDYLAHEFLTDHWQPLYSMDVHQQVHSTAKISYLGSAMPCENMDGISIPLQMQSIIQKTQAPALKEYLKDLARDAKQRVDLFQKYPQPFKNTEHLDAINTIYFQTLPHAPQQGLIHFQTPIGDIEAPQALIATLFAQTRTHARNFSELSGLAGFQQQPIFLIETLFLLMQAGYMHPVSSQRHQVDRKVVKHFQSEMQSKKLNLQILPDFATAMM